MSGLDCWHCGSSERRCAGDCCASCDHRLTAEIRANPARPLTPEQAAAVAEGQGTL